jgi:hypothetical protein
MVQGGYPLGNHEDTSPPVTLAPGPKNIDSGISELYNEPDNVLLDTAAKSDVPQSVAEMPTKSEIGIAVAAFDAISWKWSRRVAGDGKDLEIVAQPHDGRYVPG